MLQRHPTRLRPRLHHVSTRIHNVLIDAVFAQASGHKVDEVPLACRPDVDDHGSEHGEPRPVPPERLVPRGHGTRGAVLLKRVGAVVAEVFEGGADERADGAIRRLIELAVEGEQGSGVRGKLEGAGRRGDACDEGVVAKTGVRAVELGDALLDQLEDARG